MEVKKWPQAKTVSGTSEGSLTLEAESASHEEETSEMEKEPALLGENLWDQGVRRSRFKAQIIPAVDATPVSSLSITFAQMALHTLVTTAGPEHLPPTSKY